MTGSSERSLRSCPLCDEREVAAEFFFHDPDGGYPEALPLGQCRQCGLVYLRAREAVPSLYSLDYYGKRRGLPSVAFEPFNRFWIQRKARRLAHLLPGKRVLDFGCGRGDFLEAMRHLGFESWGVETQEEVVAVLRSAWGRRVATKLEDLPATPGYFDGVTLWHVLEHLEEPREVLLRLSSLTKVGGYLFLALPNWDSWERRLFGDRWFHLDVPRHRQQFGPQTLVRLLSGTGWSVQSVRYNSWAYNLFGLFQSLLNLGPGPRNFCYRSLKRGNVFDPSAQGFWTGLLWNILALAPTVLMALFLVVPLTLLRKTGTLEALAVRK